MLGDGADRYAAALSRLHHELLVDERDPELLSDRLAYLARAAGDIARHRDHGHMLLSSLPPKKRHQYWPSRRGLSRVAQGYRGVMKRRSKAHAYWTIRVPARSVGLKSSRNRYCPGASIFPEASPDAPGFTNPLTALSSSGRNYPSGPTKRRLLATVLF